MLGIANHITQYFTVCKRNHWSLHRILHSSSRHWIAIIAFRQVPNKCRPVIPLKDCDFTFLKMVANYLYNCTIGHKAGSNTACSFVLNCFMLWSRQQLSSMVAQNWEISLHLCCNNWQARPGSQHDTVQDKRAGSRPRCNSPCVDISIWYNTSFFKCTTGIGHSDLWMSP